MHTVKSGRLGVLAAVAAVIIGAGGVAYAGAALATPSGARAATVNHHPGDDCPDQPPGYDTVRPSHQKDDCDEGPEHGTPCPTDTTTTPVEVIVDHKKPRDHETPYCPTATETTTVPTETATSSVPVETSTAPGTETATASPTTSEPTPVPTTSTPTPTPTPCDEDSSDDDCGVVTQPPGFTG